MFPYAQQIKRAQDDASLVALNHLIPTIHPYFRPTSTVRIAAALISLVNSLCPPHPPLHLTSSRSHGITAAALTADRENKRASSHPLARYIISRLPRVQPARAAYLAARSLLFPNPLYSRNLAAASRLAFGKLRPTFSSSSSFWGCRSGLALYLLRLIGALCGAAALSTRGGMH